MAPLPSARWHRVVMCGRSQKCWEHLGTLWWRGLFGGNTRVPMGILLGHWIFFWDRWEQNVFITKIRGLDRGCFCTIFPMDMRNRWDMCACFWFLKQTIEPNIWYITKWVYTYCIYIYIHCTYIYILYIWQTKKNTRWIVVVETRWGMGIGYWIPGINLWSASYISDNLRLEHCHFESFWSEIEWHTLARLVFGWCQWCSSFLLKNSYRNLWRD